MTPPPTPKILGIVNITEDSFSDGGRYLTPEAAIAHGRTLVGAGAAALDLGAAASNPKAAPVPPEAEIARLDPVVAALHAEGVAISLDTFAPEVQRWGLDAGVAYLNDIHGFADPALYPELADAGTVLIVMHAIQQRGVATAAPSPQDIWAEIERFFDDRVAAMERAGISRAQLILDPGMGFFLGKDADASLDVLRDLSRLKRRYDCPVLVSVSRKSFLRTLTGAPLEEVGPVTLAGELAAALAGADWVRTHDVAQLSRAFALWQGLDLLAFA